MHACKAQRHAREGTKARKERHKGTQGKAQRHARKGTKTRKERYKIRGTQGKTHNKRYARKATK